MRLLSCYIEGYGKIKRKDFSFDEGVTSFLWENGEGKSTLASFLKAMLYGLKGYTAASKDFCDRKHFYPFDGGKFGGNLCLEAEGKEYKIERFFDKKSETGDGLTVYVDGKEMANPPAELGKLLLGVDKESFERTLFLRHDDLEISSTTRILTRLNRFLGGAEDEDGLDGAKEILKEAAKEYKKSKGGNDKISEAERKLDKLNVEIENAASVKNALDGKYTQAKELESRINELNKEIANAQKQRELASQMEHYDTLIKGVEKAEKELADLKGKYPHGVPSLEESKKFNEYMGTSSALQTKLNAAMLSVEEGEKLALLNARFKGGAPDDETLDKTEEQIKELAEANTRLSQSQAPTLRERELENKFFRRAPTEAEMQKGEEILVAYKAKRKEMENTPAFSQGGSKRVSAKGYAVVGLIAALLLIVGAALLFADFLIVGGALAATGGISVFAVGFLYLNKKSSAQDGLVENAARSAIQREAEDLERSLHVLLLPLGYGGDEGAELAFAALKRDLEDYEEYLSRRENARAELESMRGQASVLDGALSAFFAGYGETNGEYFTRLSNLKTAIARWCDLTARKAECDKTTAETREELASWQTKIEAYKMKYGLQVVDYEEVVKDATRKVGLEATVKEESEKATAFKREKGLDETQEVRAVDLESMQEELSGLQKEKARLDKEIEGDERTAEQLEDYEREQDLAKEQKRECVRKHKLLIATLDTIEEAAGRLRDKYVKPVKDEFLRYAAVIEKALGEKVVMTKEFELRFERGGEERSEKHLSSGQRSICALCFRLALIKNMYEGKLPFLVLDDPFAALDEEHLKRVKGVLAALSKDMQMIYLTCHPSREM